jgi:glycosyltransferase involved in cell wall biosynthesis
MKNEYDDFHNIKIRVIGNCYSKQFDSLNESLYKKKKRVVFLSNLMRSKGILEFLDACEIILKGEREIEICIAGMLYPDDFMDTKSISKVFYRKYGKLKMKNPEKIHYLGVVKGKQKIELLLGSDIFVLPTWYPPEAYPISIIEAMRAGNAIVATLHNYLPAIVKPENGILIKPKSNQEIVNAILCLLDDEVRLRNIQRYNRDYAISFYNQEKYVNAVKAVIFSQNLIN